MRGAKPVQIASVGGPEGGPIMLHMFLSFSLLSLSVDCTN